MNDAKNLSYSGFALVYTTLLAIEMQTVITIVSAVVLPILFFAVGKFVDVRVQIYLDEQRRRKAIEEKENE